MSWTREIGSRSKLHHLFSHTWLLGLYTFNSWLLKSRTCNVNDSHQGLLLPHTQHTGTCINTELHLAEMKNHLRKKLFKGTNFFSNLLDLRFICPDSSFPWKVQNNISYSPYHLASSSNSLSCVQDKNCCEMGISQHTSSFEFVFSMVRRQENAGMRELTLQHWGLERQHRILGSKHRGWLG